MPLLASQYNPPLLFKNGHFSTIYAGLVRRVNGLNPKRERLKLLDGDFIDMDWCYTSSKTHKLIILLHGLEGNSDRPYVQGSAKTFNQAGYDAVIINFRSCSGEPNLLYKSYHSGASEDLEAIIEHILSHYNYNAIVIKGFSLGGNVTLKYLGERTKIPSQIKAGIAISVPCYLYGSMLRLHSSNNILYAQRFKKHLLEKLRWKQKKFPELVSDQDIKNIHTLKDFDDFYTSKAHGFKNALDYYEKCSSLQFLHEIKTPAFILNAKNDSFLSKECFPVKEAKENPYIHLEISKYGGHVGFYDTNNIYYNEKRALEFVNSLNI
ncbi:YheT family hydrolase [Ascidiimonas sp. W6]|uniref:YheT family hydrolase n=1 Tax=Ascidiimonas meishanensis TaxID=3128903 RepID=UPI0030EE737E